MFYWVQLPQLMVLVLCMAVAVAVKREPVDDIHKLSCMPPDEECIYESK